MDGYGSYSQWTVLISCSWPSLYEGVPEGFVWYGSLKVDHFGRTSLEMLCERGADRRGQDFVKSLYFQALHHHVYLTGGGVRVSYLVSTSLSYFWPLYPGRIV
jgi:hypothetical protein